MRKEAQFWVDHVAAVKREGLSGASYARRESISIKSLNYWQRKLRLGLIEPVLPEVASNFVALRVADAPAPRTVGCTLVLSTGLRLEMAELPSTQWLVTLTRTMQSAR